MATPTDPVISDIQSVTKRVTEFNLAEARSNEALWKTFDAVYDFSIRYVTKGNSFQHEDKITDAILLGEMQRRGIVFTKNIKSNNFNLLIKLFFFPTDFKKNSEKINQYANVIRAAYWRNKKPTEWAAEERTLKWAAKYCQNQLDNQKPASKPIKPVIKPKITTPLPERPKVIKPDLVKKSIDDFKATVPVKYPRPDKKDQFIFLVAKLNEDGKTFNIVHELFEKEWMDKANQWALEKYGREVKATSPKLQDVLSDLYEVLVPLADWKNLPSEKEYELCKFIFFKGDEVIALLPTEIITSQSSPNPAASISVSIPSNLITQWDTDKIALMAITEEFEDLEIEIADIKLGKASSASTKITYSHPTDIQTVTSKFTSFLTSKNYKHKTAKPTKSWTDKVKILKQCFEVVHVKLNQKIDLDLQGIPQFSDYWIGFKFEDFQPTIMNAVVNNAGTKWTLTPGTFSKSAFDIGNLTIIDPINNTTKTKILSTARETLPLKTAYLDQLKFDLEVQITEKDADEILKRLQMKARQVRFRIDDNYLVVECIDATDILTKEIAIGTEYRIELPHAQLNSQFVSDWRDKKDFYSERPKDIGPVISIAGQKNGTLKFSGKYSLMLMEFSTAFGTYQIVFSDASIREIKHKPRKHLKPYPKNWKPSEDVYNDLFEREPKQTQPIQPQEKPTTSSPELVPTASSPELDLKVVFDHLYQITMGLYPQYIAIDNQAIHARHFRNKSEEMRWPGLFEQGLALSKWSLCLVR